MRHVAFACTYGNQSLFELLGRDPFLKPLEPTELALFVKCVEEFKHAEFSPRESDNHGSPDGGEE